MKKVSLFLVLLALLACVLTASAQKLEGLTLLPDGSDMLKYGNPDIDLAADELLETFDLGDIVTVTLEGYGSFDVPVCSNYDDVFMGEKLLRTVSGKPQLCLAINYGQLGLEIGIIEKAPAGADYAYQVKEGVEFPINVTIEMKEKGEPADFDQIAAEIAERDHRDMTREVSPLRQADDAVLVDTSDMTIDQVTQRILEIVKERTGLA